MRVVRVPDPEAFEVRARPVLMQDEARNNLMLGIVATLLGEPARYPEFHLWVVEDGERPMLVALQTPPWNLLVSGPARPDAIEALAAAVHDEHHAIPGVTGAVPEVDTFAESWGSLTYAEPRISMEQGIYQLTAVRAVRTVDGALRDAGRDDRDLLISWVTAFVAEADPGGPADVVQIVDSRLSGSTGGLVLWEVDARPASLAGYVAGTPNGVRIGPVYTPPELRGRGYATALVAGLSRRMLEEGRMFCFLYTDLLNATSNRIYQRIGYDRVCDSKVYRFEQG